MRIVCYFINFNDSFYIPFFYRHYSQFCEKIVCYDQHSTDGSRELCKSLGIEVRSFGDYTLNDQAYLEIKNNCWKECRGKGIDYVIVVDVDEFVVVPTDVELGTFPAVKGFNMISEEMPGTSIFEINTGEPSESYSKQAIFSPDYIQEINFIHGCHRHNAVGELVSEKGACLLYHYRQIGGVELLIERHKMYLERMSPFNHKYNMGIHYKASADAKREEWNYLKSKAVELW